MKDTIYRADAIEAVMNNACATVLYSSDNTGVLDILHALPSAEAVQGEWLYRWSEVECSVCGEFAKDKSNFCPNCGAKMKGGDTE